MDQFAAAMTFAQIVGLLADYAASRGSRDALDVQDLARWAATHGHNEVMAAIERNQATAVGVRAALAEGRDELLAKLVGLDEKLSAIAAGMGPLEQVARALRPDSMLSDQAQAILCEFERVQAGSALEHISNDTGAIELLFLDAKTDAPLEIRDRRFYHDDMEQLVRLELLRWEANAGHRHFRITRLGAKIGLEILRKA